ncbi:phage portal protein [Terriglobus aquaticus]|uniref:Phage portal protein n=1 Tax=Terriglobus aquaticus TaxID=940139 RepID=A0ABW9KI04_9BACT|nr:phage portal protein [Terriglobus aquaticus]
MGAVTRLQGALRTLREKHPAQQQHTPEPPAAARALPALLQPWRPQGVGALPKPTAANLRRMAEQPVVRRAINLVKDRVVNMRWQVSLKPDRKRDKNTDAREAVLLRLMDAPNPQDSFRTLIEPVLEDVIVGGFGSVEIEHTDDPDEPLRLWPIDGAAIQVDAAWNGDPAVPRYAYAANPFSPSEAKPLLNGELMYIRLNPRTHTPLGLGRVEVAFDTVNQFLTAHRYAGRLASNSVVQYALWLDEATPAQHERLIRWWQDEVEGTGQVPILSTDSKPEVLRFGQGTDADLRLEWQQFLVRVIANAFDMPPMFLGLQEDVNRSTATEMSAQSFESAVLPVASLLADHITRDVFDRALGWDEFRFEFVTEARDEATVISQQVQLLSAGILTVDEVRAQRGLPPMVAAAGQPASNEPSTEEDDAEPNG